MALSRDEAWEVYQGMQQESRESDPHYVNPRYAAGCKGCPHFHSPSYCDDPCATDCQYDEDAVQ